MILPLVVALALHGASARIRSNLIRMGPQSRIINGKPVQTTSYPWMVSLRADLYYDDGTFDGDISFCSGVLIQADPPAVLTAAHCLDLWTGINGTESFGGFGPYNVELFADLNRAYPDAEVEGDDFYSLKVTDILQISYHPQFDFSDISNAYDIGMIVFADGQAVDDALTQDMLPEISAQLGVDEECCVEGETLTLVGYGQYGPVHPSDTNYSNETGHTLETTTMEYTPMSSCLEQACPFTCNTYAFPGELFVCVEAPNDDTGVCNGDGGGPMLRADTNELLAITTLTLGDNCAIEAGSAGMSVAHHRGWIYGILAGDIDPPEICSSSTCTDLLWECRSTCAPTMEPTAEPTAYDDSDEYDDSGDEPTVRPSSSPSMEPTVPTMEPTGVDSDSDSDSADSNNAGALWCLYALISAFALLLKM